jgi:hypothetical protein
MGGDGYAYRAEYKVAPENAFAGLGYDTVKLLADAIKRAGSADPKAIRTALQATKDLPGVTGAITYQEGSRIPQKGVTVILVKGGTFTVAQEIVPQKVPSPRGRAIPHARESSRGPHHAARIFATWRQAHEEKPDRGSAPECRGFPHTALREGDPSPGLTGKSRGAPAVRN